MPRPGQRAKGVKSSLLGYSTLHCFLVAEVRGTFSAPQLAALQGWVNSCYP